MLIPLLALVIGLQSAQELESRLRQKEQEVERLTADLGAERRFGSAWRVSATGYVRQDDDRLLHVNAEYRLADGRLVRPAATAAWANRLDGTAHEEVIITIVGTNDGPTVSGEQCTYTREFDGKQREQQGTDKLERAGQRCAEPMLQPGDEQRMGIPNASPFISRHSKRKGRAVCGIS